MNDLVVLEQLKPLEIFTPKGTDDILERLKKEARSVVLDISTKKGRDQITSLAYKIAKSKSFLDDMGKELVSGWKEQSKLVDAERKRIRDGLDSLKDEIRAPLTEWENKEEERVNAHESALVGFDTAAVFTETQPKSAEVQKRIDSLGLLFDRDWQEFSKRAELVKDASHKRLSDILASSQKYEDEQAELERLRREDAERKQRDHEERLKAEAAQKAKAEAEEKARKEAEAEAARVKADQEKAEQERQRIEREKDEADARATKAEADRLAAIATAEADKKAAAEKVERERFAAAEKAQREKETAEHDKAEAEARAKKSEEERLAAMAKAEADRKAAAEKTERDRIVAAEQAKRDADAAAQREREKIEAEKLAEAEATAKREADKKHKAKINNEVLAALVALGLSDEHGKKVIEVIAKGQVPHVKISY